MNKKILQYMFAIYAGALIAQNVLGAITSTVAGQTLDNTLFSFIAFIGVLPLPAILSMIIGATLFEVIYEIIFYPITRFTIETIKKEGA